MEHQTPPAFFVRGPSPLARLTFFAAVSISLMAVDARLHYLTEIRQGIAALLHPLEVIANAPAAAFRYTGEYISTQSRLVRENQEMHALTLRQSADLQRFRTLEAENTHLRSLLGTLPSLPPATRMGEIVHTGRDPFTHKVVVNLGARQGIKPGQAVIDEAGVVGQVTQVYPFSSEVTLVTDKDLAVPIQIERTGMRAIAFGNSRANAIDLPYLPVNVDIQEGDKLVTSGIDGVYPSGLAVAMVSHINRTGSSPFAQIACTPTAGIESHRQVLLIPQADTMPPSVVVIEEPHSTSANRHAPRKH